MPERNSDIDLLAISDSRQEIEKEANLLPLNVHLTAITYKDFIVMLKSKCQLSVKL